MTRTAALALAAPAAATPAEDFGRLLEEHYAWLLRERDNIHIPFYN